MVMMDMRKLIYKSAKIPSIEWNADAQASGVYFVKLNVNGYTETQKLMLIK